MQYWVARNKHCLAIQTTFLQHFFPRAFPMQIVTLLKSCHHKNIDTITALRSRADGQYWIREFRMDIIHYSNTCHTKPENGNWEWPPPCSKVCQYKWDPNICAAASLREQSLYGGRFSIKTGVIFTSHNRSIFEYLATETGWCSLQTKQIGGERLNGSKDWGLAPWLLGYLSSFLSLKWSVQQLYEVGAETPHSSFIFGSGGSHWVTAWPKTKASSQNCSKLSEGQLSFRAAQPKLRVSPCTRCLLSYYKYFSTTLTSLISAVRHKEKRGSLAALGYPFTPQDLLQTPWDTGL